MAGDIGFAAADTSADRAADTPILPGMWIYTREWQGPLLEVVKATEKRITCVSYGRRCFVLPSRVIAVGATKADVQRAECAAKAVRERRGDELKRARDESNRAKTAQYALEREIEAEANAAAKAEGRS